MKQSRLSVLLLPVLSSLLLLACDESSDDDEAARTVDDSPSATEDATSPDAARREGGELTVASLEFGTLDPHAVGSAQDGPTQRMLWRSLFSLDRDNKVVWEANGIATGPPEVSEDGRVYTVQLNDGLAWSDGDDLKAEDFVVGVKRTCNPIVAAVTQYLLSNLAGCDEFFAADPATADLHALEAAVGVRALDELTLEFTLNEPQPTFPIRLALSVTAPLPVHLAHLAVSASEPGDYGTDAAALVYNGPYVLTDYVQGDSATVEPNERWSGSVRPTLERITLRFIDDLATAVNAYRTSEVQVAVADVTQLAAIKEEFGSEHLSVVSAATKALRMQLANATLANLDVRLALARAIDRETLNRVVAQDAHEPTTSWVPEEISGTPIGTYDDLLGFEPEAAREHLSAAGFPNGEGFPVLTMLTLDSPVGRSLAEFLQEQFRTILNIEIAIEVLDPASLADRLFSSDFELIVGRGFTQDYPDPENWFIGLFETGGSFNLSNCDDPEVDSLMGSARFNLDEEERLATYRELELVVLEKLCGLAPYWHDNAHYLVKPDLIGLRENATSQDFLLPGEWIPEAWGYVE